MRDHPKGPELLDIARKILREELLPLLPKDKTYSALMVANAITIAARQMRAGDAPQEADRAALKGLLDAPTGDLSKDMKSLAGLIRIGARDPGQRLSNRTHAFLLDEARRRVEESNPKYLDRP